MKTLVGERIFSHAKSTSCLESEKNVPKVKVSVKILRLLLAAFKWQRKRSNPKASHSETLAMMLFNKGCLKYGFFSLKYVYKHIQVKKIILKKGRKEFYDARDNFFSSVVMRFWYVAFNSIRLTRETIYYKRKLFSGVS